MCHRVDTSSSSADTLCHGIYSVPAGGWCDSFLFFFLLSFMRDDAAHPTHEWHSHPELLQNIKAQNPAWECPLRYPVQGSDQRDCGCCSRYMFRQKVAAPIQLDLSQGLVCPKELYAELLSGFLWETWFSSPSLPGILSSPLLTQASSDKSQPPQLPKAKATKDIRSPTWDRYLVIKKCWPTCPLDIMPLYCSIQNP